MYFYSCMQTTLCYCLSRLRSYKKCWIHFRITKKKWGLIVNVEKTKTKIIVFRNGGNIRNNEKWYYNNENIEIVNEFNYLGLLLNYNGKFFKTQKHISEQGQKALFAILNVCNSNYFNIETCLSVFDTYVSSVLNYGCEVWGFHKASNVEKTHTNFWSDY